MSRYSRERLIDEVKKYPVLYDTKHEHHRDIDVRDRCWQEIGERIGANSESLKREWKILRDSLRQAVKRTGGAGAGAARGARAPKRWRFQTRMAYILPYVTYRGRDLKHIKTDEPEEQSDHEQSREQDAWGSAGGTAEGGAGSAGSAVEDDALELFFASVCQSSKRLPRRQQAALKRHVLDALLRAEEDALADSEAKPFGEQA